MEKIKSEQLTKLQELVGKINTLKGQVADLEIQKNQAIGSVFQLGEELNSFQLELNKEYGDVSINIQDGTISENETVSENGDS
jgi:hypothetical protein